MCSRAVCLGHLGFLIHHKGVEEFLIVVENADNLFKLLCVHSRINKLVPVAACYHLWERFAADLLVKARACSIHSHQILSRGSQIGCCDINWVVLLAQREKCRVEDESLSVGLPFVNGSLGSILRRKGTLKEALHERQW